MFFQAASIAKRLFQWRYRWGNSAPPHAGLCRSYRALRWGPNHRENCFCFGLPATNPLSIHPFQAVIGGRRARLCLWRGSRGGREPALSLGCGCSGCSCSPWGLPVCLFSSVLSSAAAAHRAAQPGSCPAGEGSIPSISHGTQNNGFVAHLQHTEGIQRGAGGQARPQPHPSWSKGAVAEQQCPSHTPPSSSSLALLCRLRGFRCVITPTTQTYVLVTHIMYCPRIQAQVRRPSLGSRRRQPNVIVISCPMPERSRTSLLALPFPCPARFPGRAAWLLQLYFRTADWSFPCHRSGFLFNSLSASQISKDGLLLCLLWKKMHCRKLFLIKVNKVSLFLFFPPCFDVVANFSSQRSDPKGTGQGPARGTGDARCCQRCPGTAARVMRASEP